MEIIVGVIILIPTCMVALYLFPPLLALLGVTLPFVGIGIVFGSIDLGYDVGTNILVGLGVIVLGIAFWIIGVMLGD